MLSQQILFFLVVLFCTTSFPLSGQDNRGAQLISSFEQDNTDFRNVIFTIGIDDYLDWSKLDNAVKDAAGISRVLREKFGFIELIDPLTNQNATKDQILFSFEDQLRSKLKEKDNLIVFYAGHGHTRTARMGDLDIETGYLIPVDAPFGATEQWSKYLRLDEFLQIVSELPPRHITLILDACHSGFALGTEVEKFRSANSYTSDLIGRRSRKVITSARKDQLASDKGPIPGHSLFTGTLVEGLRWGTADYDLNGFITTSELGLFLQQRVSQVTGSSQTPDFGSFYYDDRGEMVIELNDQSMTSLQARAFNNLQAGNFQLAWELTENLDEKFPQAPITLYMKFRKYLHEKSPGNARFIIEQLIEVAEETDLSSDGFPLSDHDLWDIRQKLKFWTTILQKPESKDSLQITMLENGDGSQFFESIEIGEVQGFKIEPSTEFRFEIRNENLSDRFVYFFQIDQSGRLDPINPWHYDDDVIYRGIPPKASATTLPFIQDGSIGLVRFLVVSSEREIRALTYPPSTSSRGAMDPFEYDLNFQVSSFWFTTK